MDDAGEVSKKLLLNSNNVFFWWFEWFGEDSIGFRFGMGWLGENALMWLELVSGKVAVDNGVKAGVLPWVVLVLLKFW